MDAPALTDDTATDTSHGDAGGDHLVCSICYPQPWSELDYVVSLCGVLADPAGRPPPPPATPDEDACLECKLGLIWHMPTHGCSGEAV